MSDAFCEPRTQSDRRPAAAGRRPGGAGLRVGAAATHHDRRMTDPIQTHQSDGPAP